MRVVAIGDVGVIDDMIHIGDEAMFEATIGELRARGVHDIVGVSANPADTAARYDIEAVLRPDGEPGPELVGLLRDSDGLIVTGGGNLSSLWPAHIRMRSAFAALARRFDIPLVVSGQTLGPTLDAVDSSRVAGMLAGARLVGVREADSHALASRLGIPSSILRETVDDASFLTARPAPPRPDYCLVTLANHLGGADRQPAEAAIAELLDGVTATTGLHIVFAAHFASLVPDPARGDTAVHDRVAALMSSPSRVEPTTDSAAAASLARGASLVVCSRYHPAVFAVAAGVPTMGIHVDDYTRTKLTGALANFGQRSAVPLHTVTAGGAPEVLAPIWRGRAAIRVEGLRRAELARHGASRWWDDVVAQFSAG